MNKILITPRSLSKGGHPELERLTNCGFELVYASPGNTPTETQLIDTVQDCIGWLAGVEPVSKNVINVAQNLRVISRNGTGIDNLPLEALEARQIALRKADGANARGVAELALALMLAGLRNIRITDAGVRMGDWPRQIGREMAESTIGIIGLGAVGETLARLCLTLGADVIGYDPFKRSALHTENKFTQTSLAQVIANTDAISLHSPYQDGEAPMINATTIKSMREGMVLINTARAQLVDEGAVLLALNSGQIANYATDVFATEPPKITPLYTHEATTLSSHIGGFTNASVARATRSAVDGLLEVLMS